MGGRQRHADVVLVTMPFAPVTQPSLALSLLQGVLEPGRAHIAYETIRFADVIGVDLYERIVDGIPTTTHLAGEWLFAEAAFGPDVARDQQYVDRFLQPAPDAPADAERDATVDDDLRQRVLGCRALIDAYLAEALERTLAGDPQLVGFTSVFQQQVASLALAQRIKAARPDITIVMGGANCEGPMGQAILERFDVIDAVVSGEGEAPFRDLVDQLDRVGHARRVPGVVTRSDVGPLAVVNSAPSAPEELDMDELPVPSFHDFFDQWSASITSESRIPFLLFESARGCWWGAVRHCTFCGLNGDRMAFRSKSPQRAVDELRTMTKEHPGLPVYAVDNIIDRGYFDTVLPVLAEDPTGAAIFFEVKADLTKDQLTRLRDAGVRDLQPGIESLHDSVLRLMRKGVTALGNIQFLKWCVELGVRPHWNLLWGFPGEPAEAFTETTALLPRLAHLPPPGGAGPIRLDRFSPNFEDATALGFANVRPVPAYRHVYRIDNDTPDHRFADLAYFFDFDREPAVDHRAESRELQVALATWHERHESSGLWAVDDGEVFTVWDFRHDPSTASRFTGVERDLMIALDQCRSTRELSALLDMPADRVCASVERLVSSELVVTDGRRHLALPVWLGDREMPTRFLVRMAGDLVGSIRRSGRSRTPDPLRPSRAEALRPAEPGPGSP